MSVDEGAALARLPEEYRKLMVLIYRRLEREEKGGCYELRRLPDGRFQCFLVQRHMVVVRTLPETEVAPATAALVLS